MSAIAATVSSASETEADVTADHIGTPENDRPIGIDIQTNKLEEDVTVNGIALPAGTMAVTVFYYKCGDKRTISFGKAYEIIRSSETEPLISFESEGAETELKVAVGEGVLEFAPDPEDGDTDKAGKFTVFFKVDEELEKDIRYSGFGWT